MSSESLGSLFQSEGPRAIKKLVGEEAFRISFPIEQKFISEADKKKKEAALATQRSTAAAAAARGKPVAEQLKAAEPEKITPINEQRQVIIDERGRRRRVVGGGKQSTILAGTNTRLKQRLGE